MSIKNMSVFCANKEGGCYYLFNKKSTKERCSEVMSKLRSFNWFPKWHNMYDLKGNKEWWAICFPELMNVDTKTAWAAMPKEMLEYIKSLPEYNEKVFNAVTEMVGEG